MVNPTTGLYRPLMRDPKSGELVADHLRSKWVKRFMFAECIVSCVQTGKLMSSAEKQELVEREAAYHLDVFMCELNDENLDEECVFNADEMHFLVNLYNGRTPAMKGDSEVKYCNFFSGNTRMTLMVMVGGGSKPQFEVTFIILQNDG